MATAHPVLGSDEIRAGLRDLDQWSGGKSSIRRTAKLASFPAAIEVVRQVADVAEAMDHHPDIDIRWRTLTFICTTHSKGGVTDLDLTLAGRIDAVIDKAGRPAES